MTLEDISAPYCDVCKAMLAQVIPFRQSFKENAQYITEIRQQIDYGVITREKGGELLSKYRKISGEHHRTPKELFVAAASGCGICTQFEICLNSDKEALRRFWRDRCVLKFGCSESTLGVGIYDSELTIVVFGFEQLSETNLSLEAHRSILSVDTGASQVLQRARSWLSCCTSQHDQCEKEIDTDYYPPRLLSLEGHSVRLLDTQKLRPSAGRYAALSYCCTYSPVTNDPRSPFLLFLSKYEKAPRWDLTILNQRKEK